MKKALVLTLFLVLLLGTTMAYAAKMGQKTFNDLPKGHWAYAAVEEMREDGILDGFPDMTFRPAEIVTYGEFIKMATTMTKVTGKYMKADAFQHWAQRYYECGLCNFYYTESEIPKSKLGEPISRGDMALIISNLMKSEIKTADYGDYEEILEDITDVDSGTKNEAAIIKAYATGVLSGYPDGSFHPNQSLSRAEAASVILRAKAFAKISTETEEEKPTLESESPVYAEELVLITLSDYGSPMDEAHKKELLGALKQQIPSLSQKVYTAAITFAERPLGEHNMEIRKQYIGKYPVLMEHSENSITIHIYSPGSCDGDEGWKTKKGEINDSYI